MDEQRRIFQAIADDFANRNKIDKIVTTECDRIINDKVRPAIQKASEVIKLDRVLFNVWNREPSILVLGDDETYDEMLFRCNGSELEIWSNFQGREPSLTSTAIMSSVSDYLAKPSASNRREAVGVG